MPQPRGAAVQGQQLARHWPALIQDLVTQPPFFADGADVVWAQRISWDALVTPTRLKKHPVAPRTVRLQVQAACALGPTRRRMPVKSGAKPSVNMY